ncbi:MAG: class I SAM-dependent methyltransferase [Myxococcales bacterium]|nr:class I SAM-dependent methyltransferase [Myxococcales bacterium]
MPFDADDFREYFAHAPAALALRECVRLRALRALSMPAPVLDVGCGDGLFARLAFPDRVVWGVDVSAREVDRARRSTAYRTVVHGSICEVELPDGYFRSALANCSLEHISDVEAALRTIARALVPGAPFVAIVPLPDWTHQLAVHRLLSRAGLAAVARAYAAALDRTFAHVHMDDEFGWRRRLHAAGFDVERVVGLVGADEGFAFDVLLPPSGMAWLTKRLTGRWVWMPAIRRRLAPWIGRSVQALVRHAPDGAAPEHGELLIVARRVGSPPP